MSDDRYRATLDRLFELRRFGLRPGLEVVQGLLGALGHPERSFRSIHVAGSKGKGSVAAMAARILTAGGARVGLFTSPHLRSYRERIQVNGRPIPKSAVVKGIHRVETIASRLVSDGTIDRPPTFFETTTALAFDWFRERRVEHAVVEVGLGGRLDSTNVLDAPVGVITTIELEHTEILGPTLTDVAREKAGILHPGMRGVVGEVGPEALREIERAASAVGVHLIHLGREIRVDDRSIDPKGQTFSVSTPRGRKDDLRIPLRGIFQPGNAALAVAAVEEYAFSTGLALGADSVRAGLRATRWRGRLERAASRPELYLDVAHTPESARVVAQSLAEIYPFLDPAENVVLFGCLADKKVEPIFEHLALLATTLVVVPLTPDRAMPVDALKRAGTGRFAKVVVAPDVPTGLALARAATGPDGFTLAVGSDYLVGDLLQILEGPGDGEPDLSDPAPLPTARPAGDRT
ncbi:MAG TPA: folylpolyglutamate synthase/dihydrofolate synthase family protein [Thermoplasmata archaeon]